MTNHPNRKKGPKGPSSTPEPEEIFAAREVMYLTQEQAAEIIYCSKRAWEKWEQGERRMHPGLFELFKIKTGQTPV